MDWEWASCWSAGNVSYFDLGVAWKAIKTHWAVFFFFFFFAHVACGIFVLPPGLEPAPPALRGQHLSHGTTRKSLSCILNIVVLYRMWVISAKGKRIIAIDMQFEVYLLTPVLYQEDQILQLAGMVAKKLLLEFSEADWELTGAGFHHIQGSFELSIGAEAGLLT